MKSVLRKDTSRAVLGLLLFAGTVSSSCAPMNSPSTHELARAQSLIEQGILLLRARELDRAGAAFSLAYQIGSLPEAIDGLGCVDFLGGDYLGADTRFRQALTLNPENSAAMANLALANEALGRRSEAHELFRRAIALDPQNVRARNNLAALISEEESEPNEKVQQLLLEAESLEKHPLITENLTLSGWKAIERPGDARGSRVRFMRSPVRPTDYPVERE